MNTYCIGDVQGCKDELFKLLDALNFDTSKDRLVLLGDLINRGPKSLETLRLCRQLGNSCHAILGNHDLAVLARIHSNNPDRINRTAAQILDASDSSELLNWLRSRPLALLDDSDDQPALMIHAGLAPQWDVQTTLNCAREVEAVLRNAPDTYFNAMYGDLPDRWSDELAGMERLRFITNCLTRLRYCSEDGQLALQHKSADGKAFVDESGTKLMPWFAAPNRKSAKHLILFGHWSTLHRCYWPQHQVWGLDTGCVWGSRLTALHLQTRRLIQAPAPQR